MRCQWLVPVALAVTLTGCGDLMFVEPLASDSDKTFDKALVGNWYDRDSVVLHVTAEKPPVYDVTILFVESGKSAHLQGRLVRLGDQQILDLYDPEAGLFNVGCHVWVYVQRKGTGLEIAYLDSPWLQARLKESGLRTFEVEKHPVSTASTAQLREFAAKYAVRPEARAGSLEWSAFKKKP